MSHRHRPRRDGAILLTVLVVIALITVSTGSYFKWTFTEHKATRMFGRQTQTRYAAESGVVLLQAMLAEEPEDIDAAGGLFDNPARMRGILLLDSQAAGLRCRMTMLAPNLDNGEYTGVRFGLENESSRLNLNTILALDNIDEYAARNQLMGLPSMTESIADAILDWIDTDSDIRPLGAELTHYAAQTPAYGPQNGPLESLDQLLLVRDITPELLYGLDRNRDFFIDELEAQTPLPADIDNTDGKMNRGWAAYLTLYSAERELNPDGEPKINVNSDDLEQLHSDIEAVLGLAEANFIIAFRQGGPSENSSGDGAVNTGNTQYVAAESVQIDFNSPGAETIDNLMRLVGVDVDVVQANENQQQTIQAIYPDGAADAEALLLMEDYLTVYDAEAVPGRLNINQAPRALLQSVPGMPIEAVEAIIGTRSFESGQDRPERRHASWLYSEGYVTLEEIQQMASVVTCGGNVYRGQIVGFFDEEGPRSRLEVVIDATTDAPMVVYQQDLSPLGGGPTAAELGAEALDNANPATTANASN